MGGAFTIQPTWLEYGKEANSNPFNVHAALVPGGAGWAYGEKSQGDQATQNYLNNCQTWWSKVGRSMVPPIWTQSEHKVVERRAVEATGASSQPVHFFTVK